MRNIGVPQHVGYRLTAPYPMRQKPYLLDLQGICSGHMIASAFTFYDTGQAIEGVDGILPTPSQHLVVIG
jgi:hypothetical protein